MSGSVSDVESRRTNAPMAEECLRNLLENDDYLSRVFRFLVGDGLHECSRVCRRWRELSLSMHPKLVRVPSSKTAEILSKYSNTISISVKVEDSSNDINSHLDVVKHFPKIEHLFLLGPLRCSSRPPCSATVACLNRLLSLSVWLSSSDSDARTWIAPALKHLTNLTYLQLTASEAVPLEPIAEIRKIEKLCLGPGLLIDRQGDLVFPALTNLTSLELTHRAPLPSPEQYENRMHGRLLEVNLFPEC